MLRYETGQFYKVHHDQNSPRTSAWGPRIYTFFMYLNEVEAGGHTHFPRLNISVKPRRGAALLWPSVLDADPNERDDRTEHESVAVVAGTKFAASARHPGLCLSPAPAPTASRPGPHGAPHNPNGTPHSARHLGRSSPRSSRPTPATLPKPLRPGLLSTDYWLHMWDFQQPTRHGCGNTEIFGNW